MEYICPNCNAEKGVFSLMKKNEDETLVCRLNPAHCFKIDGNGLLCPANGKK